MNSELTEQQFSKPNTIPLNDNYIAASSLVDVKIGSKLYLSGWMILKIKSIENGGLVYVTDHNWRISNVSMQQLVDESRVKNLIVS